MSKKLGALVATLLLTLIITTCSDDGTSPPAGGGGNNAPDTVAAPTFSPTPGTYHSNQSVSMSCATSGAEIYYTTDRSDPTQSSTLYVPRSLITVSSNTNFRARAFKTDMVPSDIVPANYTIDIINVEAPVFNPTPGVYHEAVTVTATCATPNAVIYYTSDGSDPTPSDAPFPVRGINLTVTRSYRARAYVDGIHASPITAVTYSIITGLVAQYKLDANTQDSSGNNRHARNYGPTLANDRNGIARMAYAFDGTDDYMQLPDESAFDLSRFTIMGWFHFDTLPPIAGTMPSRQYVLINKGLNYGNYTISLRKIGGASYCNIQVVYQTTAGNITDTCTEQNIYLNTWTHIAVSYDTDIKYYINGQLVRTYTPIFGPRFNNSIVLLGIAQGVSEDWWFNGSMEELRFYSWALSDLEVERVFNHDN